MRKATVLVVDDTIQNARLLEAILSTQNYSTILASSGTEALEVVQREAIDLVLLDILMPGIDGYEVARRLRASADTAALPIVMVTSATGQEKVKALEAGADDFIQKPFDRAELLARVKSLLRVKQYHDTIQRQASELAQWNETLSANVDEQVHEIQRLARLRRFLSPQLADLIISAGEDGSIGLESHRRQVAVLFADLRGFTPFAEVAEPEDVMTVLREFHDVLGELVRDMEATVGYFAGDGLMVFFNDPIPCQEPALKAVTMAVALRERLAGPIAGWARLGHNLGVGVGITYGYATLGEIGFEGRVDYGAIGSVVNLASRLCAECEPGQILVNQPVCAAVEEAIETEPIPALTLKGFAKPVPAYNVVRIREVATMRAEPLPGGLTAREAEVLRGLASGLSSRKIGDALYVSERTVERHIANIYNKTGVHGRAEATAWAIRYGVLDVDFRTPGDDEPGAK